MIERVRHIDDCAGDRGEHCDLSDDDLLAGINLAAGQSVTGDERKQYHDRDDAVQDIYESPLSVQVRGGWHDIGVTDAEDEEFEILLSTGGPAARIIGDLGMHNAPEDVQLQYQDWFTPWESVGLSSEDRDVLAAYCEYFVQF